MLGVYGCLLFLNVFRLMQVNVILLPSESFRFCIFHYVLILQFSSVFIFVFRLIYFRFPGYVCMFNIPINLI